MPDALRTGFHWLRVVDPIVLLGYGLIVWFKRRNDPSVRALTRSTAVGVGIAFGLAAVLFAMTLVI